MKRACVVALALALCAAPVPADDRPVSEAWPGSVGVLWQYFPGSFEPETSLSYQFWFGRVGLTLAGGGIYDPDLSQSWDSVCDYNVQLFLAYRLYEESYNPFMSNNLQVLAYLAHRGLQPLVMDYDTYESEPGAFETYYHVGAGLGMETVLLGHFSQTLDFLYVYTWPDRIDLSFGYAYRFRY